MRPAVASKSWKNHPAPFEERPQQLHRLVGCSDARGVSHRSEAGGEGPGRIDRRLQTHLGDVDQFGHHGHGERGHPPIEQHLT